MRQIRDNIAATYSMMVVTMYTLLSCVVIPEYVSISLKKVSMLESENDQLYNCMFIVATHIMNILYSLVENIIVSQGLYIVMLITLLLIEIGRIDNNFNSVIDHGPKCKNKNIIVSQGLYIEMLITILLTGLGRVNNILNSIIAYNPKLKKIRHI